MYLQQIGGMEIPRFNDRLYLRDYVILIVTLLF